MLGCCLNTIYNMNSNLLFLFAPPGQPPSSGGQHRQRGHTPICKDTVRIFTPPRHHILHAHSFASGMFHFSRLGKEGEIDFTQNTTALSDRAGSRLLSEGCFLLRAQ